MSAHNAGSAYGAQGEVSACHHVMCLDCQIDFDAVIQLANESGWLAGSVARARTTPDGENETRMRGVAPEVRRCGLSTGAPKELVTELAGLITGIGQHVYGFDVDGLRDYDPTFINRYQIGDHFTWHTDNSFTGPPGGTRKLSFSLQLSRADDYDGGDLEFATYSPLLNPEIPGLSPVLRERGSLIIFPSFMLHRVHPVTRGVRYALVGWIHGPPFK